MGGQTLALHFSNLYQYKIMPCALTAGYTFDCRDNLGGAKELKVIEVANVVSMTLTAGVITAVANAEGKRWWKYRPAKDTAYGKSTLTTNVQNGTTYFAQEVGLAINKMQTAVRIELGNMARNQLYIVIKDANGKNWLYGYSNGMDNSGGESGTGTGPGDRNGYSLTFTGQEPDDAYEMDEATYNSLETPGEEEE